MKPVDEIKKPIEVCLEILNETDGAYRVTDWTIPDAIWIPKSQIAMEEDGGPGDTVTFILPEWLVIEKEFI